MSDDSDIPWLPLKPCPPQSSPNPPLSEYGSFLEYITSRIRHPGNKRILDATWGLPGPVLRLDGQKAKIRKMRAAILSACWERHLADDPDFEYHELMTFDDDNRIERARSKLNPLWVPKSPLAPPKADDGIGAPAPTQANADESNGFPAPVQTNADKGRRLPLHAVPPKNYWLKYFDIWRDRPGGYEPGFPLFCFILFVGYAPDYSDSELILGSHYDSDSACGPWASIQDKGLIGYLYKYYDAVWEKADVLFDPTVPETKDSALRTLDAREKLIALTDNAQGASKKLAPSREKARAIYEWALARNPDYIGGLSRTREKQVDLLGEIHKMLNQIIQDSATSNGERQKLQEWKMGLPKEATTFADYLRQAGLLRR